MQWTLGEKIGKGGNGIVFRASSAEYPPAAVKLLTSFRGDHFARFETEIRALKACQGENIVPILDSGYLEYQGKPTPFYAMPVYRTNLRTLINQNPNGFGIENCLYFFEKLLAALVIMHSSGILHRDIKPENILIDDLGSPCLGDFGLAKAYSKKAQHVLGYGLTRTNNKAAPANYMSPEQLMYVHNKNVVLDERSDLFQMGKVFYECLTGKNPLGQVSSPGENDKEHLFRYVVSPLIRQNPDERPKTSQEILDVLHSLRIYGIDKTKTLASGELVWAETTNRKNKFNVLISDSQRVVWHQYDWDKTDIETYIKPLDQNTKFVYPLFDILQGYCVGFCSLIGNYPEQKLFFSILGENREKYCWTKYFNVENFTPHLKEFMPFETRNYQPRIHEFKVVSCGVYFKDDTYPEEIYLLGEYNLDIWLVRVCLSDNTINYKLFTVPASHPEHGQSLSEIVNTKFYWGNNKIKIKVNAFFYNDGDGGGPYGDFEYEYLREDDSPAKHATTNFKIALPKDKFRTHNLEAPSNFGTNVEWFNLIYRLFPKAVKISSKAMQIPEFSFPINDNAIGVLPSGQEFYIFGWAGVNIKVDRVVRVLPSPYEKR